MFFLQENGQFEESCCFPLSLVETTLNVFQIFVGYQANISYFYKIFEETFMH